MTKAFIAKWWAQTSGWTTNRLILLAVSQKEKGLSFQMELLMKQFWELTRMVIVLQ